MIQSILDWVRFWLVSLRSKTLHHDDQTIAGNSVLFRDSRQDHTDYEPLIANNQTEKSQLTKVNNETSNSIQALPPKCLRMYVNVFQALGFIICCFVLIYVAAMMSHTQCDPGNFICKNPRFEWKHPEPFSPEIPDSDKK